MADGDVIQVQLTEDGSRPVDLPTQFKTVADMVNSYTEAQATITRQATQIAGPEPKPKAPTKPTTPELPPEVASALENIATFNEARRNDRFTEQVGAEGVTALNKYLESGCPEALKASYDAAIATGNEALIDANFNMIRQSFEAANGSFTAPQSLTQGYAAATGVPQGTKPFESLGEQKAAQKDPKYQTDTKFREDVERRIAISGPYRA